MFKQALLGTIYLAMLSFVTLNAREVRLALPAATGDTIDKSGVTLALIGTDVFLISDEQGIFRNFINDEAGVDLPNGRYSYDLTAGAKISRGTLIISDRSPESIAIKRFFLEAYDYTSSEKATASDRAFEADVSEGDTEGGLTKHETELRRLSVVRVSKQAPVSDKRVILAEDARKLPGTGGDVLGSLSSLPGVIGGTGGDTTLIVRGGTGNDVSYRYRNIVVGSPYHELFFFSVFPAEIISRLAFYPGGFPAQFENVQGSVVDIIGQDFYDHPDAYSLTFNLSLVNFNASLSFEFLDKFRLTFGGRRSYLEAYITLAKALELTAALGEFDLVPIFYDTHAIFEWQLDPTRNFNIIFLYSGDDFVFNRRNTEFESLTDLEKKFFDSSISSTNAWDSESVIYQSQQEKYEYNFAFYRYGERSIFTNAGKETRNISEEEYSFRHDFNVFITDIVTLKTFVKYSLNRAHGSVGVSPLGRKFPNLADYFFGASTPGVAPTAIPDSVPNDNEVGNFFVVFNDYFDALKYETHNFLGHRVALGGHVLTSIYNFTLDTGLILYGDSHSTRKINGDFRLRGTYWLPVRNAKVELFGYVGRYVQHPALVSQELTTGLLFFRDYDLKAPHTYQFGFGTTWSVPEMLEVAIEPYYKLLVEQIYDNPTFDSAYPIGVTSGVSNFPSINYSSGFAAGVEVLLQKKGGQDDLWDGWIAYSWSLAFIDRMRIPVAYDRDKTFSDQANNGSYYLGFEKTRVPYEENVEHSLKLIFRLGLWKNASVSFRLIVSTGMPYTPKVIGTNSQFTTRDCTKETFDPAAPCNLGFVFVDDPNNINAARLPWQISLDVRFDWTFVQTDVYTMSFFTDVIGFEALFYKNISSYGYDRSLIAFNPAYSIGDSAPIDVITEQSGGVILPIVGFEFNF